LKNKTITIYYNPRCSKCRETAALVREHGYTTELIEYLLNPPKKEVLQKLLLMLDMKPLELIRQGDTIFKQQYAGKTLTDEEWLTAMVEHPVLIERPIVVLGEKAVVARPPEKILSIL